MRSNRKSIAFKCLSLGLISISMLALAACGAGRHRLAERLDRPASASPTSVSLVSSGQTRTYEVATPDQMQGAMPLVIVLHGGGGNSSTMAGAAGWARLAKQEGFIAAFPDGTGRLPRRYTWNAGGCCAYAMTSGSKDVRFISDLIDVLTRDYPVDARRIYLSGISNGGMLTYRASAELSERLAASATVVGAMFEDQPAPASPLPLLAINAMQDGVVPYLGGKSPMKLVQQSQAQDFLPSEMAVSRWAMWNGCQDRAVVEDQHRLRLERFSACRKRAEVQFLTLKDGGHGWPGGAALRESPETASDAINATETIWAFFRDHARD